jgi:tetratricopeptide (TPR) repeat protein
MYMKKLIVPILLMSLAFCLFISGMVISPPIRVYVMIIAVFAFLFATVLYRTRDKGPYIKKINLAMVGLFGLGFSLYIGTGNIIYFFLGILGIPLVLIWVSYLRHPPYLWRYVWLFRKKRYAEAAQIINEWIRDHPNDWKAIAMRSDFHLNRAQPAEAERDSKMVIKIKLDFHEGYNQLGRSLLIMAQYEEARRAFETAQKLKPNSGYLSNIGLTCYRLGDFPAAIEALTQATRSPLDHPLYSLVANYFLGKSLENMGETKKAQEAFKNMKQYASDLKSYIKQANAAPDYPEQVATRADLADIQQRLNA